MKRRDEEEEKRREEQIRSDKMKWKVELEEKEGRSRGGKR